MTGLFYCFSVAAPALARMRALFVADCADEEETAAAIINLLSGGRGQVEVLG